MTHNVIDRLLLFIVVSLLYFLPLLQHVSSFQFPVINKLSLMRTKTVSTTTTSSSSSQLWMAGFGTSAQSTSKKSNKKGKKKKKETITSASNAELTKNRLIKRVKKIYGGITPEQIAKGTESRINSMIQKTLSIELQKALELRSICHQFDRQVSGMDFETIRAKYSNEEIEVALTNRQLYNDHLANYQFTIDDLQVAMQRITWDASADAKACKSVTGSMPITFQNRVMKASQYAYDVCSSSDVDNSESDDDKDDSNQHQQDNSTKKILDVGVGYGLTIPFLKQVGFTAQQIHGIDLSAEMIQHAHTFYPDVATQGKLQVLNFSADKDAAENNDEKYRVVLFLSSLHDLPDMKRALWKTKNELLERTTTSGNNVSGSRIIIVHPQGASQVHNEHKQNPDLIPRGLPTTSELQEWLCDSDSSNGNDNGTDTMTIDPHPEIKMKLLVEPAEAKSEQEIREGYLAVLELI